MQGVTNQRKISAAVALTVSQIAKPPAGRDAYPKPGFKPVVEIPYLHTMLDVRLSNAHQDAGGKSDIAPFILAEDTEGLGERFV